MTEMTETAKDELIQKLLAENKAMRAAGVLKVTKDRVVAPADYDNVKRDLRKAREKIKNLLLIIENGKISTLTTLIDDYTNFSRTQLKAISQEAALCSYSTNEVKAILKFTEYLSYVSAQLYGLVSIYQTGKYIGNEAYNGLKLDINEVKSILNKQDLMIILAPEKMEEFHHHLKVFRDGIEDCIRYGGDLNDE